MLTSLGWLSLPSASPSRNMQRDGCFSSCPHFTDLTNREGKTRVSLSSETFDAISEHRPHLCKTEDSDFRGVWQSPNTESPVYNHWRCVHFASNASSDILSLASRGDVRKLMCPSCVHPPRGPLILSSNMQGLEPQ